MTPERLVEIERHAKSMEVYSTEWGGRRGTREIIIELLAALDAAEVSKAALVKEVKRLADRVAVLSPGFKP